MTIRFRPRPLLIPLLIFVACSREPKEPPKAEQHSPPPVTAPQPHAAAPAAPPATSAIDSNAPKTRYRMVKLTGAAALTALVTELGEARMQLVYRLNRRDLKHLKSGDSIVVPTAGDSILDYSPFPRHLDDTSASGKLIVVSRRVQAFAAYEHGSLVRWGPTSTGKKKTPTPEGLYHTNWKSKETHSTVDDAWVLKWYFNLDNLEGISMHEYDLPGYPASHSCVRLLSDDAEWLYQWADQWTLTRDGARIATDGTPVIVFGEYAYGKTPPWKKLAANEKATTVTPDELNGALTTYLPKSTAQTSGSHSNTATSEKEHNHAAQ